MAHGGPKLLLDRRASPPRTPNCPAASQTTPGRTPVRLAPSQSAQGGPHPSRTTPGPPGCGGQPPAKPASAWIIHVARHERSRHTGRSRP